jgi:hypothetical protein
LDFHQKKKKKKRTKEQEFFPQRERHHLNPSNFTPSVAIAEFWRKKKGELLQNEIPFSSLTHTHPLYTRKFSPHQPQQQKKKGRTTIRPGT